MKTSRLRGLLLAAVSGALAVGVSSCSTSDPGTPAAAVPPSSTAMTSSTSPPSTVTTPAAPVRHWPSGPPLLVASIAPLSGTTVGVAMPISIVFASPVKESARKQVERHLRLATSTPVTGAWHWFGNRRVDFRPQGYWTPGTSVRLSARLKHVASGFGRYGTHAYTRAFTIGADVRTHVYADKHTTVVTKNGKVLRSMSSDAGSPQFPSWDGTMAVVAKSSTIRMTSCSVQITCDKKNPNFYDLVLPWDVRITTSGTFLHYSTGDPYPGHSYGSHGCIHLSMNDAKWYYDLVEQGDPVTITGSPRGKAAADNGYADYNLGWKSWVAGSGLGPITT